MNGLIASAKESGMAVTMFGRRRALPEINSKNFTRRSFAERTAMNTPIQGSAADIIKLAMNAVQDELEKRHLKSQLLVQVHDELVLKSRPGKRMKWNSSSRIQWNTSSTCPCPSSSTSTAGPTGKKRSR